MKANSRRVFVTDCEGPLTKNDNAAEMAEAFLPQGAKFFAKISLYDDYLAEVARIPDYKAGDTLRLILPFFKAYGVDDRSMVKFSRRNIEVIPQAREALSRIAAIAPCYIVSTSYTPYIKAVCDALEFPLENTFSTEIDIDSLPISSSDKTRVKDFYSMIVETADFHLPQGASSINDLDSASREVIAMLDRIFWIELPGLDINRLMLSVNPVGGREKAASVEKIVHRHGCSLGDVMYVGDSITDIEAFRLVRKGGGLAVSFNGNQWAVCEADLAVTSSNALPTMFIASMFLEHGIEIMKDLLVVHLTENNIADVTKQSVRVRKTVRSEKIGSLG